MTGREIYTQFAGTDRYWDGLSPTTQTAWDRLASLIGGREQALRDIAVGREVHRYRGRCPDALAPDERDPDCSACRILEAARREGAA